MTFFFFSQRARAGTWTLAFSDFFSRKEKRQLREVSFSKAGVYDCTLLQSSFHDPSLRDFLLHPPPSLPFLRQSVWSKRQKVRRRGEKAIRHSQIVRPLWWVDLLGGRETWQRCPNDSFYDIHLSFLEVREWMSNVLRYRGLVSWSTVSAYPCLSYQEPKSRKKISSTPHCESLTRREEDSCVLHNLWTFHCSSLSK